MRGWQQRLMHWRSSLTQSLQLALQERVVWFTSQRFRLGSEIETDRFALLAVIGREWYHERSKHYNLRDKTDLQKVIDLEVAGNPRIRAFIGPMDGEGHRVTFFELSSQCDLESIAALLWIPESWLLSQRLQPREIATVSRSGLRYFQSAGGTSQIAGGLMNSAAVFAMAAGLPEAHAEKELSEKDVPLELAAAVSNLGWRDGWAFRSPLLSSQLAVLGRPAAALAAGTLLGYLLVASAWLEAAHWWRARELARYGDDVAGLVDMQREIDWVAKRQTLAAQTFASPHQAVDAWAVVKEVWQRNAALKSLTWEDGKISLTGFSPLATEVLKGLSEHPMVESAQFTAPVRETRGAQDFAIEIQLKDIVEKNTVEPPQGSVTND